MPTNYTANYALNQWQADDKVLRTDFNADNAKIDAALKSEVNARTALAGQVAKKAEQSALNSEVNARASADNAINSTLAKKGNCTIYTTSYVGDGQKTQSITFPKKPAAVFIMGKVSMFRYVTGLSAALSSSYGGTGCDCQITWSGNTMTWVLPDVGSARNYLCNNYNETYYVIALIDAST